MRTIVQNAFRVDCLAYLNAPQSPLPEILCCLPIGWAKPTDVIDGNNAVRVSSPTNELIGLIQTCSKRFLKQNTFNPRIQDI
jgi:hypothetical protein